MPALIFVAVLYIAMNYTLTTLAGLIERRTRRRGHTAALPATPSADEGLPVAP